MASRRQDIALFLSSTFQDMQAEREVLVKGAFPRLQQRCFERGARLHVVDLRWGIPPDRSASDEVIETCLREVERCRPFFVAVLGQRYGWIPEQLGEGLVARHPWLSAYPDRSLTELEIRHGALDFKGHDVRARFYLRDPSFLDEVAASERAKYVDDDSSSAGKLDDLLDEIRRSAHPWAAYADPEGLAGKLVDDLMDEFEGVLGAAPVERERRRVLHQEIMGDPEGTRRVQRKRLEYMRARNSVAAGAVDPLFVDERERLAVFRDLLDAEAPVLGCVGSQGSGTSHLLAHAARVLAEGPRAPICVSFHTAELGDSSVINYFYWELSERIGRDEWRGLEAKPEDLLAAMRSAARRQPVLLTIDGATASILTKLEWTHVGLPAGCKLAFSAEPGALPDPLPGSWVLYDVPPPSAEEARLYLCAYFARYGKALSTRQQERLVRDRRYPTFGKLARVANELRVFGRFEDLDQTIDALVNARSDLEFYGFVLDRLALDLGEEATRLVELLQALVTVRRERLTDEAAIALLDLPPLDWVRLRTRLGVLFEPDHPYEVVLRPDVAEAARRYFLATEDARRAVHARLAMRYAQEETAFGTHVGADEGITSRAYHLDQANLLPELEALLGELRSVKALGAALDDHWAKLPREAHERLLGVYEAAVRAHLRQPDPCLAEAMVQLACFCARRGLDAERRRALSGAVAAVLADPEGTAENARWTVLTWPAEAGGGGEILAALRELLDRGAPVSANKLCLFIASFERQLTGDESAIATAKAGLRRGLEQGETEGLVDLACYVSWLAFEVSHGDGDLAALLSRALDRAEFREPVRLDTRIDLLHRLGWIHAYGGRLQLAFQCFEEMNAALDAEAPPTRRAQVAAGKAEVLSGLGRHPEALEFGGRALAIRLEESPPAEGLPGFATLLARIVQAAGAKDAGSLGLLEQALKRAELDGEEVVTQRARIRIALGFAYWRSSEFESAFAHFRAVMDSIDPAKHPGPFAEACCGVGYVQLWLGQYEDAVVSFDRAIELFDATEDETAKMSAAVARVRKASALNRLGRQQDARRTIETALSLMERQGRPASERAWAFETLAQIHDAAGDTERAAEARERARELE